MTTGTSYTIGGEQNTSLRLRLFHSVVQSFQRAYTEHRHTAFELSLICSGTGIYRAGEKSYCFREGDVFLFSTNEPHCIVEANGVLDILNLQFEPRFLWSAENALYRVQYPDIFFKRNEDYAHKLSIRPDAAREIARRLQSVEQEFLLKKMDYRFMVKLQILELLVLIRREYADWFQKHSSQVQVSYLAQMERAQDYIDRNLAEEIHLEEVAREAAMSSAYFSTLFKKLIQQYFQFQPELQNRNRPNPGGLPKSQPGVNHTVVADTLLFYRKNTPDWRGSSAPANQECLRLYWKPASAFGGNKAYIHW